MIKGRGAFIFEIKIHCLFEI